MINRLNKLDVNFIRQEIIPLAIDIVKNKILMVVKHDTQPSDTINFNNLFLDIMSGSSYDISDFLGKAVPHKSEDDLEFENNFVETLDIGTNIITIKSNVFEIMRYHYLISNGDKGYIEIFFNNKKVERHPHTINYIATHLLGFKLFQPDYSYWKNKRLVIEGTVEYIEGRDILKVAGLVSIPEIRNIFKGKIMEMIT